MTKVEHVFLQPAQDNDKVIVGRIAVQRVTMGGITKKSIKTCL